MYFKDRCEAGQNLAVELIDYRFEKTAVLALSPGGVVIGEQIAKLLHTTLSLLLVSPLELPGLGEIGSIDQAGNVTYGGRVPMAVVEEYAGEMRGLIEEEKLQKLHEIGELLSEQGSLDVATLEGHHIIIASDGLDSGLALEAATLFLKPVQTGKIIGATGVASVAAVDRMHILCDEIHVLNVANNYMGVEHYYQTNDLPDTDEIQKILKSITANWR